MKTFEVTVAMAPRPSITIFCFIMRACSRCTQLLNGRQSAVWPGIDERWPKGERICEQRVRNFVHSCNG
jgi:hypothetical protein